MMRIAVLGGGLMGVGIAQTFAASGHFVRVYEPSEDARTTVSQRVHDGLFQTGDDPANVSNVAAFASLAETVDGADYVTEAIPEKLELKRTVFAQLERLVGPHTILATNSSVIPVTLIARDLPTAHRMVGTHWWNPAPLIPLVEVIQGALTSDDTVAKTMDLLRSIGKVPAHVKKDVPGFVGNRLQHALWREAIAMVAEGICDAATVDSCVKNSFGLRLPVLGPLENADLVGLDLTLDIHRTIIPELDRHEGPNELLQAKVAAGELGFKSGVGFQTWTPQQMDSLRQRLTAHLLDARTKAE